eukprot:scaffold4066_cov107-Isochrysis_galbana.AAC.2
MPEGLRCSRRAATRRMSAARSAARHRLGQMRTRCPSNATGAMARATRRRADGCAIGSQARLFEELGEAHKTPIRRRRQGAYAT